MLITTPRNIDEAKKLLSLDFEIGFLIGITNISAKHHNNFSLEEIDNLLELDKTIILRLDNMLFDEDLAIYLDVINRFSNKVKYYVNDLGLVELLLENNLKENVIYDSLTMVTNYLDFGIYADMGIDAVGISSEIPFRDVLKMNTMKGFYQFFGYRQMFVSKREVISLYEEHANLSFPKKNLSLIEQTRNDIYPCFEDELGCYIYRSYALNLLEHLKDANFKYLYLESMLIPWEKYYKIVSLYVMVLNDKLNINAAMEQFKELDIHVEEGFTYKDSVYQKEEF